MTTYTVTVELFVNDDWLDITRLDSTGAPSATGTARIISPVRIVRGRTDEQASTTPTEVTFRYQDDDALLDGANPVSPFYRRLGLGTQMRVKVDGEIRASVEIGSLIPSWDEERSTVIVDVTGYGVLKRLDDTGRPLNSPAYRAFTSPVNSDEMVAYFPIEEESGASIFRAPFGGSITQGNSAQFEFGALDSVSSARLGRFGSFDTFLDVTLPTWTNSLSEHFVGALVKIPSTGIANNAIMWRCHFTGGTVDYIDLLHTTGEVLQLLAYRGDTLLDTLAGADWTTYLLDQEAFLITTFDQNGADVDVRIRGTTPDTWLVGTSDTLAGQTLGRMYRMVVATGSGCDGMGFGQLVIGSNANSFGNFIDDLDSSNDALVTGARAYDGECAGNRLVRLGDEEDVSILTSGTLSFSTRMGFQGLDKLTDLIRECSESDLGILFENKTTFSVAYRTRHSLYNQTADVTLDYDHLSPGFRESPEDHRVVNDVTVQRDGGGSAQYAIPDDDQWHWTTQDQPDGAGPRPFEYTLALHADSQMNDQAAWRAHVAAWREKKFRQVTYELHRSAFTTDDRDALRAAGIGSVIAQGTSGAPPWVPYNEVRLLVQGYTEVVDQFTQTITFNTTPADIYEVEVVDSGSTSTLVAPITTASTSIKLAPGDGPTWDESAEPFHISIDGQPMTVTAITTDTVAFIAAGAVSYADNASVTPALPAGMTPDVGQLMVAVIFRRASGAGIIGTTPTGWTTIADSANGDWRLAGRYYETGDAAVQWTFSGGAANDTTGGVVLGFSGLSMTLDKNIPAGYSAGYVSSVNSSAQNIAYPVYLNRRTKSAMLLVGIKDDDWTSVATVAGTSELVDSSSTTGSDVGIVVDLYNPGTPTTVAAGSFTVTGGASAVSVGIVAGLRPLQSATVTRNIAGVLTAESVGATVHVWRPGAVAL